MIFCSSARWRSFLVVCSINGHIRLCCVPVVAAIQQNGNNRRNWHTSTMHIQSHWPWHHWLTSWWPANLQFLHRWPSHGCERAQVGYGETGDKRAVAVDGVVLKDSNTKILARGLLSTSRPTWTILSGGVGPSETQLLVVCSIWPQSRWPFHLERSFWEMCACSGWRDNYLHRRIDGFSLVVYMLSASVSSPASWTGPTWSSLITQSIGVIQQQSTRKPKRHSIECVVVVHNSAILSSSTIGLIQQEHVLDFVSVCPDVAVTFRPSKIHKTIQRVPHREAQWWSI